MLSFATIVGGNIKVSLDVCFKYLLKEKVIKIDVLVRLTMSVTNYNGFTCRQVTFNQYIRSHGNLRLDIV